MVKTMTVSGALAIVAMLAFYSVAFAGVTKVGVCHMTSAEDNEYVLITVADVAFPAHEAHGDFMAPEDGDCSGGGFPSPF